MCRTPLLQENFRFSGVTVLINDAPPVQQPSFPRKREGVQVCGVCGRFSHQTRFARSCHERKCPKVSTPRITRTGACSVASTAFLQAFVEVVEQFLAQFRLLVFGGRRHAFLRQFDEGFLGTA
jgi:hypothetical protein